MIKPLLLLIIVVFSSPWAYSEGTVTGAPALQRFVGARAAGMADSFSTVRDDASSWQYNPAMLGTLSGPQLEASVLRGFADDYLSGVSAGYPTALGTFAVNFNYYDTGSEKLYASDGSVFNVHLQRDMLGAISYGKKIGVAAFGANVKYLNSELAEYRAASCLALDVGGAVLFDSPAISLGVSLRNMGRGMIFISERDPLPKELRAGVSYAFNLGGANSKMFISADVPYMITEKRTEGSLGAEWALGNGLSIRIGQHINSDLLSTTFGFGVKTKALSFDYSFGAAGSLDNIHTVTVGYRWGA